MTTPPNGAKPEPPRRPARDPYGLLPTGMPIAAVVSIIGLLVIAIVTLNLTNGKLPFTPGGGGSGPQGTDQVPTRTATPSNVVEVPSIEVPGIDVPGTLVYAKDGNIWIQSGDQATQLTAPGKGFDDSMPSFSPDGKSVYFVRTRKADGKWSIDNVVKDYALNVPDADARQHRRRRRPIACSTASSTGPGSFKWNGFIREPAVSPDGRYVAMATDLPDPTKSDVTLKLFDTKTDKINDLKLNQVAPLGHQDPAWKPDGSKLLYVLNDRDGAKGSPRIYAWSPDTGEGAAGHRARVPVPAWSPDGRYIAATKTSAYGTDIVILNAANGAELARLTDDGNSWAPTWSPRGDQVAYLHVAGQVIDLRMAQLDGTAPNWTVKDTLDLTTAPGLDGVSRPDWYVPAADLPAATARRRTLARRLRDLVPGPARRADRGDGLGPVRGHRPRPRGAARRFPRVGRRRGALLPRCSSRRRSRTRRRSSPTSRSSRRSARRGSPRSSGCAPRSRPTSRSSRTRSGATSARRPPGRRWRCSTCSGADAVTVNPYLGEEAIAPLLAREDRFAYVLCRTSNPGAAELQALEVAGGRRARAPRRAAVGPGRASRGGLGPGRHRRPRRRGDGARRARARSARIAPGLAFLVPGVGAQGGEVEPVLADGPATAAPAGGRPGGGLLVNVSRGIARAALGGPGRGRAGGPRRAPRGGRRRVGRTPRCATLTPFRDGPARPRPSRGRSTNAVQHRTRSSSSSS